MKFYMFLFALASTGAVRVEKLEKLDKLDNSNSDAVAEATGFDGFGGFGGFRGFDQFNGFVSNAFGDLEGQFDTTGFNKDFSGSQNRKFDTGYGQHFLEALNDDSFGSDLGPPSSQQKLGRPSPVTPNVGKKHSYSAVPLPTSKYSLGQPAAGKSSYVTPKHKKVPSQYQVVPYQGLYAENLPRQQQSEIILPAYSPQAAVTPNFGTRKVTTKLVQHAPAAIRHGSEKLKYYTEQYREDEGFGFGAGSVY